MSIFQVISVLFALFMLYVLSIHTKKKLIATSEFWLWTAVWLGFIGLAIFPQVLLGISVQLRFARVFDLLVVMAFMILSTLLFYMYFEHKRLKQKIIQTVREEAIKKVLHKKHGKK